MTNIAIPNLGTFTADSGLISLSECSDGLHYSGQNGVVSITATGDGKVEFIAFADHTLAFVNSALGYTAYYPVHPVKLEKPIKAVLMDLDGTSIQSESFWVWLIQSTTASLVEDERFEFEAVDLPHVSGHSVSEHLLYCLEKYCPHKTLKDAINIYHEQFRHQMNKIMSGQEHLNILKPMPGLKEFLLTLKAKGIKIALVTSSPYEKAYAELLIIFRIMDLGDPKTFYDAIITMGFPVRTGEIGTLSELPSKPHPWLYAEACQLGLHIPLAERNSVIGIEDSGAGVCSVRLAGFPTIGLNTGNIIDSGTQSLCDFFCESLSEILKLAQ